jgi:hypothetical protein
MWVKQKILRVTTCEYSGESSLNQFTLKLAAIRYIQHQSPKLDTSAHAVKAGCLSHLYNTNP